MEQTEFFWTSLELVFFKVDEQMKYAFIQVMNYTFSLLEEMEGSTEKSFFSFCDLFTVRRVPQALKLFFHYHSFFISKYK